MAALVQRVGAAVSPQNVGNGPAFVLRLPAIRATLQPPYVPEGNMKARRRSVRSMS
jgi:hypothetical protein